MPVYTRARKILPKKRSRTMPVFGKGEDEGKYYRCWDCHFVCDKDRDSLGDSTTKGGDKHLDALTPVVNDIGGNTSNQAVLGGCIGHYHVAAKIGADGNPIQVWHNFTSNVTRGCPNCGSTNWRGDY